MQKVKHKLLKTFGSAKINRTEIATPPHRHRVTRKFGRYRRRRKISKEFGKITRKFVKICTLQKNQAGIALSLVAASYATYIGRLCAKRGLNKL